MRYKYLVAILLVDIVLLSVIAKPIQLVHGVSSPWVPTTLLPQTIANFTVIASGKRIYSIGGSLTPLTVGGELRPIKDVYYTEILPNGSLSGWKSTSPLLDPLTLHTAVINNSTIYVIGGFNGSGLSRDTMYTTIQPDGSLRPWSQSSQKLPLGISMHSTNINGEYIYVIGGFDSTSANSLKSVYRARILAGGDIGNWERLLDMAQSTYRHTSEIYGDKLYVIGGRERHDGAITPLNSVYIGQFTPDGEIVNWTTAGFLPQALYFHGSVLSEDEKKIYTLGGFDGNSATDKVYSASIKADNTLEPWVEVENLELPQELFRHSVVLADNGSTYVIGGKHNDMHLGDVHFIPPLTLTKSNDPPGPIHEGDIINYTISYANTSLITQTMTISDVLPFNLSYIPDSAIPPAIQQGSTLEWDLGEVSPGASGQVSFKAQVPLLPSLQKATIGPAPIAASSPTFILPVPVTCDTTQFWANGVTHQPPIPNPYTIQVQVPPNSNPSKLWLLMKRTDNTAPQIEGQSAQLEVITSNTPWGASLWSAPITSGMVADNEVTVVTNDPRNLNALFLFDADDPPFEISTLYDIYNTVETFTYTLEIPSVATQTMDVLIPFMDITYWWDNLELDTRTTMVTVEFDGKEQSIVANDPNLGNGLLMTQFAFTIGPFTDTITSTKVLTVTVDTEDSVNILGPRVCRPVYIENTAWLCSQQAGCIASTVTNIPENFVPPTDGIFLPIILKSFS